MTRSCAVCGSNAKTAVYHQGFFVPSRDDLQAGYDIVVCNDCGFAFADNIPDQNDLKSYYQGITKTVYDLSQQLASVGSDRETFEAEHDVRRNEHACDNITAFLSEENRVLDIGAGTGYLLSLLKARGFHNVAGIEPSGSLCEIGRKKYGLEIIQASVFDDLPLYGDFLILSHVLEHVADLRNLLRRLDEIMSNQSLLYCEVPDAYNFILSTDMERPLCEAHARDLFAHFCPEHINFFTTTSLRNLMKRNGFEPVFLQSQVSTMGIVASVWKKASLWRDTTIASRLREYARVCEDTFREPIEVIARLVETGRQIIVWGAGLHTQRILAASRLREAKIHCFVDSNPVYNGKLLVGKRIISPSALRDEPSFPILVSSRKAQLEITRQIKAMGLDNPVVLLYGDRQ